MCPKMDVDSGQRPFFIVKLKRNDFGRLLKSQAEIDYVNFADITDYVILVVYLLSLMGVSKTERKRVLADYESILDRYKLELPPAIFGALVRTETAKKLKQTRVFVTRN